MITISNSIFDAQGESKKDNVFGITLNGVEDVLIENCSFKNQGYAAIKNDCKGNVSVENCEFICNNIYNPIEGSQSVDNGNVSVKNCVFSGAPGNNYINFYQMAKGSRHEISNCTFAPTVDNNIIRFSNRTSADMKCVIKDCQYNFASGDASEHTGFILCQDYTNKSGIKQDFTKMVIDIENVKCNGVKLDENGAIEGSVYYVYEDGAGIITGANDPVVNIK